MVYIPADISWTYFRYGFDQLGRIMEFALREAAAEPPPVEVSAPSIVQAMPHVQGSRTVVHLLNDISSLGRSQNVPGEAVRERREVIPIHDIRVTFRDARLRQFRLEPGGVVLQPEATPQGRQVTVPRLDVHAMVIAEP